MTQSRYFVSWKQKELWKNKRLHISSLGRKMPANWRVSYRTDGRQGQPASLQIPAHTMKPHICYLERESYLHVYLRGERNCCWIYENTSQKENRKKKQVLFYSWHLIIDHNDAWGEYSEVVLLHSIGWDIHAVLPLKIENCYDASVHVHTHNATVHM